MDSNRTSKPISLGNPDELARRFELFRPHLLAMARREISPSAVVDDSGSDLVQETYVAAHQQWPSFRGSSPEELLAWLRAILHRQISRRRRRQSKMSRTAHSSAEALGIVASEIVDPRASPERQLEHEEDYLRVLWLIHDMPDLQRQIIDGRIEGEETFRAIGKRLSMSEAAVRMAFNRAVEKIRDYYEASAIMCLRAKQQGEKRPKKS